MAIFLGETKMKVSAIMCIWNEIRFLPLKIKWCKLNGIEPYIIDNFSDDGSWEWLQDNNIPSHRFDTDGAFHLSKNVKEMTKTLHKIKPDWAIYIDADDFISFDEGIGETIKQADRNGYNCISCPLITFYNTGESSFELSDPFDPFNSYFYLRGGTTKTQIMISKYCRDMNFRPERIRRSREKSFKVNGAKFNYGPSKGKENRVAVFERRQKAWDQGLPKGLGIHYKIFTQNDWVWNTEDCEDIRNYPKVYKYLIKIQDQMGDSD